MTDLQKSLFETMKIFSDYTLDNSKSAKVVSGTIINIDNLDNGDYTVEYMGKRFPARATQNATYSLDEFVQVVVPEGNFYKDCVIINSLDKRTR